MLTTILYMICLMNMFGSINYVFNPKLRVHQEWVLEAKDEKKGKKYVK